MFKVEEVQEYCEQTPNQILAHGTVDTYVPEILNDGLLIKSTGHATVVFAVGGEYEDFHSNEPITHYTWYEPRTIGENCVVLLEIPQSILTEIEKSGKKICQKTIFEKICKEIELTVPDNEETREAFEKIQEEKKQKIKNPIFSLEGMKVGKGHNYGAKPGSKFKRLCIPIEYICAITSEKKVYYVNDKVKQHILNSRELKKNKKQTPKTDSEKSAPIDLYSADELF